VPITITLPCPHCQSENLVKFGFAPDGRQRYRCKDCHRQHRENPRTNAYDNEEKQKILDSTQERSSLRGISRTFGISRNTVTKWLKKGLENSQP
jgi:transposase-like protein